MLEIIKEIRAAVKNKTYIAALALAVTLPDICSQIEYSSTESKRSNYIMWINDHMDSDSFTPPTKGFENQAFAGNMCYSLRCKLLHNGTIDVQNPKLGVSIDDFILTTPDSPNYYHGFRYKENKQQDGTFFQTTVIGVDYLCEELCRVAEDYYMNHPNQTLFEAYSFKLQ